MASVSSGFLPSQHRKAGLPRPRPSSPAPLFAGSGIARYREIKLHPVLRIPSRKCRFALPQGSSRGCLDAYLASSSWARVDGIPRGTSHGDSDHQHRILLSKSFVCVLVRTPWLSVGTCRPSTPPFATGRASGQASRMPSPVGAVGWPSPTYPFSFLRWAEKILSRFLQARLQNLRWSGTSAPDSRLGGGASRGRLPGGAVCAQAARYPHYIRGILTLYLVYTLCKRDYLPPSIVFG